MKRLKGKGLRLKVKGLNFNIIPLILTFNLYLLFIPFTCLYSQPLQEIEVKAGDTLWSVANYYLKEPSRWPEILKFNNISADPNNVLPGMKLKIPVMLIKEKLRTSTIVSIIRNVKVRRSAEIDWFSAMQSMKLYNKDGIRTLENSYADVESSSGDLMTIGPSSLVIIQPDKKSDETRLLSGEIRTQKIPIITPTAVVKPKITKKSPVADYKAKVKEDQSTVVAVYKGLVDVTAKNKTVTVPEGFSTEVKINQPPMEPRELPPSMKLPDDQRIKIQEMEKLTGTTDIDSQKIKKDSGPDKDVNEINVGGELSKSGKSSGWLDITHYHIQVAKDMKFSHMVFDAIRPIYEKFDVKKTDITDGEYFWRVAYLDSSGAEGILSYTKKILVDKTPPALTVDAPQDNMKFSDKSIKVKGISEHGAVIDINGNYVSVDSKGNFSTEFSLIKGENIIKVSSKDQFGNISTVSLKVYQTVEGLKQKKRGFFSTPFGIVISIITISTLTVISIIAIAG